MELQPWNRSGGRTSDPLFDVYGLQMALNDLTKIDGPEILFNNMKQNPNVHTLAPYY